MAIIVPGAGDDISAATFGKPVADAVNRIAVQANRNTSLACPTGLQTAITLPNEVSDPSNLWNGTQLTFTTVAAGIWTLSLAVQFAAVTSFTSRTTVICDIDGKSFGVPIVGEVRGVLAFTYPVVNAVTAKYSLYTEFAGGVTIQTADLTACRVSI